MRGALGRRYFADWVADQLRDFAGAADRDLAVRTTLDPRMQAAAEAAVGDILTETARRIGSSEGALVAMAPDGAVRAMVGGRDYGRQPVQPRDPGAAPAGLGLQAVRLSRRRSKHGLRPADRFVDQPVRIGNWQPHNF